MKILWKRTVSNGSIGNLVFAILQPSMYNEWKKNYCFFLKTIRDIYVICVFSESANLKIFDVMIHIIQSTLKVTLSIISLETQEVSK